MKKLLLVLLCLLTLSACADARAKLQKSEKVLQVGKESISDKELFGLLIEQYGAEAVITIINDYIYNQLASTKEDFTETIESYCLLYSSLYGPTYYQRLGFASETAFKAKLLQDNKTKLIVEKYLESNFDKVVETYRPTKLAILQFTEYDDAVAALAVAKTGVAFAELAGDFKATDFSDGSVNIYTTYSGLSPEVTSFGLYAEKEALVEIPLFSGDGKYYIIQVISVDRQSYKEEILEVMAEVSNIPGDAISYYCELYQLTYYDKTIIEHLVYTNPSYLR